MPIQAFKLPGDLPILIDLIPLAFQYPEHEAWSMQADEIESFVDSTKTLHRLWPLLRVAQVFSPSLRDLLLGYIWFEDDRPVGLTNVLRQGSSDRWIIGNVAVLPDYRRRGIARQLVAASVDLARQRGARAISLDVVADNLPAYALYDRLGFVHYTGRAELVHEGGALLPESTLPDGYTLQRGTVTDWRPRYSLAQRITPDAVQQYTPVEADYFRQSSLLRALAPLIQRAMGNRVDVFKVHAQGQIVASGIVTARLHPGGMNSLSILLDPAHAALAPAFVDCLLRHVLTLSPGRRTELSVPHWQPDVIAAALAAGFVKRCDTATMGTFCD
ncbi:MAG: GNAT family N-acetyltransferase [Chloroflexi bacterium]|nr:GNAT family N-acetyltransferase [Chloroflexota bacterium]